MVTAYCATRARIINNPTIVSLVVQQIVNVFVLFFPFFLSVLSEVHSRVIFRIITPQTYN